VIIEGKTRGSGLVPCTTSKGTEECVIDLILMSELRRLAEASSPFCVSIYLPTHQAGDALLQNPIRLKNLLVRARTELESLGLRAPQIDELLSAATALQDDAVFWGTTASGLAVFINADGMWTYRLPDPVDELTVVAERFHLKSLLPSVSTRDVFYLLALSQNQVRLLRGSRINVTELALREIPASLSEALRFDDREPQLQCHAGNISGGGSVVAVFHGQGAGKDMSTVDLTRFLATVDEGFREIVGDSRAPLVLAGVDKVVAHFRKFSKYSNIVSGDVLGSPDRLSPQELHDRAWPLVEPLLHAEQQAAEEAIESGSSPTLKSLTEIVVAAHDGRIESLFVPIALQRWGTFDADRRYAEGHDRRRPGDCDLFDIAAISVLVHGGSVFAIPESDIPGHAVVAAALRY